MPVSATRVCALLAHPDDEIFIAGLLCGHLERGAAVTGIWVTSGQARGGQRRREAELARATRILGLSREHCRLLRLPNRGLLNLLPQALHSIEKILDALQPECIYVTAYEGGHIEHDLLNCLALRARNRTCPGAALLEFPLYNRTGPPILRGWRVNAFPPGRDANHTPLEPHQLQCKFDMMRAYSSQWRDLLPFRLLMPGQRYLQQGEPWAPVPRDRDYSRPPHEGVLNYERNPGTHSFADFSAAVRSLDAALAVAPGPPAPAPTTP